MAGEFAYGECERCGALSLLEVPANLAEFYAGGYYSFAQPQKFNRYARLFGFGSGSLPAARRVISAKSDRVLDVGCGAGHLVQELWSLGYTAVEGIDPFMPENVQRTEKPHLRSVSLGSVSGEWDVIMYNHVFEHVLDPKVEFAAAATRLAPGGKLLIRVPLGDSWLRKHYGVDWYQWDAPRHVWLPTRRALELLGRAHGLRLTQTWSDASVLTIWVSRLLSIRSRTTSPFSAPFYRGKDRRTALARLPFDYVRLALTKLSGQPDQGCFVFTHDPKGEGKP